MEKLFSKKLAKDVDSAVSQKFVDIAEVKEDVIVLKNGSFRAILAVSAINFDLKSTEEQEGIINQYQNFLNSVDFPIQIIVSSKKLNMERYLNFLSGKEKVQPNELLRLQISEYRNFISQLVSVSNIMDKSFYIVVPFSPIESEERSFFKNLASILNPRQNILEKRENLETYRFQLSQRIEHIIASLSGIGLRIVQLNTQELIELLFNSYNPSTFNSSGLRDISNLELKK